MVERGGKRPRSTGARRRAGNQSGVPPARATPPNSEVTGDVLPALDEARFGVARILNLRQSLPTGAEAKARTEAWLRERQAAGASEVLIITGRGRGSLDGVPIVRETVVRLFTALRRAGVIEAAREHGPGAFVVELASLQALVDAPRRRNRPGPKPLTDPGVLVGLEQETRTALRRLAVAALDALGVHQPSDSFVTDEMLRQFAHLSATIPAGPSREAALRALVLQALAEFE
jgi:hypothetical protein